MARAGVCNLASSVGGPLRAVRREPFGRTMKQPEIYLDTNTSSYLYSPRPGWPPGRLAAIRARLRRRVDMGAFRVLGSVAVIEELTGIAYREQHRYRQTIRLLLDLYGRRILLPVLQMAKAEAAQRQPLQFNERFLARATVADLQSVVLNPRVVSEISDHLYASSRTFKADFDARRDRVRKELGLRENEEPSFRQWWKRAGSLIDDWTKDVLAGAALELPGPFAPHEVPSVRRFVAYYMGRMILNLGSNRRIDGSDEYDARHYVAASYADVMVTDDARFRDTYQQIPSPSFVLETFDDFVNTRLGL